MRLIKTEPINHHSDYVQQTQYACENAYIFNLTNHQLPASHRLPLRHYTNQPEPVSSPNYAAMNAYIVDSDVNPPNPNTYPPSGRFAQQCTTQEITESVEVNSLRESPIPRPMQTNPELVEVNSLRESPTPRPKKFMPMMNDKPIPIGTGGVL